MAPIAIIYVLVFGIFATLGYLNESEYAEHNMGINLLLQNSYLVITDSDVRIVQTCYGRVFYSYDVDTNETSFSMKTLADLEVEEMFRTPSNHVGGIIALLGGAGGAWTAKDLLSLVATPKGRAKQAWRAIAAGLSGYSVGVIVANIRVSSCDSFSVSMLFSAQAPRIERSIYAFLSFAALGEKAELKSKEFDPNETDFRTILSTEPDPNFLISPKDYRVQVSDVIRVSKAPDFWSFWFPIALLLISVLIVGRSIR